MHQSENTKFNVSTSSGAFVFFALHPSKNAFLAALSQPFARMMPQMEMSNLETPPMSPAVPFFSIPTPMLFGTVPTAETTTESKRSSVVLQQIQQPTRCIRCGKSFNDAYTLCRHVIKRHANNRRPHPCVHCKQRFVSPIKRAAHVYVQHVLKRRKTSLVPSRTELPTKKLAKTTEKADLKPVNAARRFSCEDCLFESITKAELEQHTQSWHLSVTASTATTPKTKKAFDNAKSRGSKSDKNGFSCDRCEYVTPYRQNLSRHLLTHKKTKKTASEMRALSQKERTTDEDRQNDVMHRCDACDYTNRLKTNIILHLRRVHGIETEKKTPQQRALEEKIFRSGDGFYRSARLAFLLLEMDILRACHNIFSLSRCPECTFRGRKRHFIAKHIKFVHLKDESKEATNENIFRCEHCVYSTTNNMENLYRHVRRVHPDAPRYTCPHARCKYDTVLRLHLARHLQTCAAEGSSKKKGLTRMVFFLL